MFANGPPRGLSIWTAHKRAEVVQKILWGENLQSVAFDFGVEPSTVQHWCELERNNRYTQRSDNFLHNLDELLNHHQKKSIVPQNDNEPKTCSTVVAAADAFGDLDSLMVNADRKIKNIIDRKIE